MITGEVASQIADRFQKLSRTRKPAVETEDTSLKETAQKATKAPLPRKVSPAAGPAAPVPPQREEQPIHMETSRVISPERPAPRPIPPSSEEGPRVFAPERPAAPVPPQREEQPIRMETSRDFVNEGPVLSRVSPGTEESSPVGQVKVVPLPKTNANYVPLKGGVKPAATMIRPQQFHKEPPTPVAQQQTETSVDSSNEINEEVIIGQQKIILSIPAQAVKQAQMSNTENKNKLAGYWSAQVLKANPQLVSSTFADPVSLWFEVKNIILKKFDGSFNTRVK